MIRLLLILFLNFFIFSGCNTKTLEEREEDKNCRLSKYYLLVGASGKDDMSLSDYQRGRYIGLFEIGFILSSDCKN